MKKSLLLFTFSFFTAFAAFAQSDNTLTKIGVGLGGGVAVGSVSSYYPEAGSLDLKVEIPFAGTPLSVLFKTGFSYYVSSNGYGVGYYDYGYDSGSYSYGSLAAFIPVQVGAKVYVTRRVYLEGDIGVSFNVNSITSDYTNKKTALLFSPGIGYTLPLRSAAYSMDFGLGYESRPEPGGGYNQVAFHADFNFNL